MTLGESVAHLSSRHAAPRLLHACFRHLRRQHHSHDPHRLHLLAVYSKDAKVVLSRKKITEADRVEARNFNTEAMMQIGTWQEHTFVWHPPFPNRVYFYTAIP